MSAAAVNHDSLRAAADWYVRLGDGQCTADDRAAWQVWYDQAVEHRDAWQRVQRNALRAGPRVGRVLLRVAGRDTKIRQQREDAFVSVELRMQFGMRTPARLRNALLQRLQCGGGHIVRHIR